MTLEISCALATSLATPEHIVIAERLGYRRAWCYDSPALYPDVWMMLNEAAARTSRIQLGPGVLIPSLRHPMTNAAAIATLEARAPGRVVVGIGSGFTGRMTLGQRPLPWTLVRRYIRTVRQLLHGEEAEWDGAVIRMLQPSGFAPARPITVPVLVGAGGPKGLAVAREEGDGILTTQPQAGFDWVVQLTFGTVLDAGEDPGAARALAAAGHGAAVIYHGTYERRDYRALASLPGGAEWQRRVEAVPERTRHLATHENHLIDRNELDRDLVTGAMLSRYGLALDEPGWRARLSANAAAGVTEIAYQPAGPDIERELTAFAHMAGL